jgi:ribosomal protein S18 acetylase RimI-like enzyme
MNIRILQVSDAAPYQEVRLHALKTNPDAFGSTYEREAAFTLETVEERIKPSPDKFVLGAFTKEGAIMGITTFVRDVGPKTSHKGHIFGMYVKPEGRGQGIGRSLMLELIRRAGECDGLEQLLLTVVSGNDAARKLYLSLGFRSYGIEPKALKNGEGYLDEDLMILNLSGL